VSTQLSAYGRGSPLDGLSTGRATPDGHAGVPDRKPATEAR